jgi:hypothetical protein
VASIPIPTGSYALHDPRASTRRLVNCFAENAPADNQVNDSKQKQPPVILRQAAGITALASNGGTLPCRGMWMMQGVEYAVIGANLYTVAANGALALVGAGIAGSGFVRMTDNTQCLVILIPNTNTAYTYTAAGGFQRLLAPGFTQLGAIDLGFLDSYIFFISLDGRTLYNDDGQAVSGTGQITFNNGNVFPREFGTDAFMALAISNRNCYALGERTSEIFIDTGAGPSVASPLASAPNGFMQIGVAPGANYCAVVQNNTVYWVANDKTVRYLNGVTPVRASNHGIEGILSTIDFTGSYGFAYALSGHLFIAWTFPAASRTLVLDVTTGEWHEMNSFGLGYWRPFCCHNAFGKFLVGDSQSGKIGYLDLTTRREWGTVRTSFWIHQPVYNENNRISHRRLELVLGGGFAPLNGALEDTTPLITLMASDDGGEKFRSFPTRSLGATGKYNTRVVYFNLGMSRQRVYAFELSADVTSWATDLLLEAEQGRW